MALNYPQGSQSFLFQKMVSENNNDDDNNDTKQENDAIKQEGKLIFIYIKIYNIYIIYINRINQTRTRIRRTTKEKNRRRTSKAKTIRATQT